MAGYGAYLFTSAKYKRFLKEQRGSGTGADYTPWYTVREVASRGQSSRPPGIKTGRVHHLLTKLETNVFHLLQWSPKVDDIRERVPLLEREATLDLADEVGVEHPRDMRSQEPLVLTTDFVVVLSGGQHLARAVLYADSLKHKRVLERLEIERRYWASRNVDWKIITDQEVDANLVSMIEWALEWHDLSKLAPDGATALDEAADALFHAVARRQDDSVGKLVQRMDRSLGLQKGTSFALLRHLIARRRLTCDMRRQVRLQDSLERFTAAVGEEMKQ